MKLPRTFPAGAVVSAPRSASKHVLRSRLTKVYPQSQIEYSYSTNNQITFDINSPTDFLDAGKSYIRMKLTATLQANGSPDPLRYFSEGGVHSLFERVEIFTKAGVLIERIDDYNRLYQIFSTAMHSKEYVDKTLIYAGDSIDCCDVVAGGENYAGKSITFTTATANYDHTGGAVERLLVLGTGDALAELKTGDVLSIETLAGTFVSAVEAVVDADSVQLASAINGGVDIAATNILSVLRLSVPGKAVVPATRKLAANTGGYTVCFQPMSAFMNNGNLIPLFLIRGGLRVVFTLANPIYCLVSKSAPGPGFADANVEISNPEWLCHFLTPDPGLSEIYMDLYRSGKLTYFYDSSRRFLDVQSGGGAGSATFSHQSNVRSAKMIFAKIQDQRSRTTSAGNAKVPISTYTCDSIAQGLAAGIKSVRFQSGSEVYPESSPISYEGVDKSEAMVELKRCMGHLGVANLAAIRCDPWQWRTSDGGYDPYETGNSTDSQRLIISALLSRDPSPFSGLDLALNQMQSEYEFGSTYDITDMDNATVLQAAASRYITTFIIYESVCLLSSEGIIIYS